MKSLTGLFAIFLLLLFSACPSSSSNKQIRKDSTSSSSISTDPEDPDTTDQSPVSAYIPVTYRKEAVELVRSTLREKYKDDLKLNQIDESSRKFAIYEYDLSGDGRKEIFVGTTGSYFCGSAGCTIFLLSPDGKLLTQFTVSAKPIVISHDRTNGWEDLYIKSNGQFHVMKFNRESYPSNPSVQPISKIVFSDDMTRVLDIEHVPYPWFGF